MNETLARIVIGAIQGRSGKTTVTIGLLRALVEQGYKVQPYKKGPDYIDPSWATMASGIKARNLDNFMMTESQIRESLYKHSKDKDLSIIEGAMGLFDGLDVEGSNSTAQLAYITASPVILVVSGQRITRSVAALVSGVVNFDPRIKIGGVILNQVARPRHENMMRQSIERYTDVPVLGALPKAKDIEIPDRHLGLIPAGEQEKLTERIDSLGELMKRHVDLKKIVEIANTAPKLEGLGESAISIKTTDKVKLGVFSDRAFSFYYPENIEALEEAGADVILINSIADTKLPEIDGLYIGGGFPEVLAEEISANKALREAVKEKAESGMPIYAECGGLMYLCDEIRVAETSYPMAGVFKAEVVMEKKPQGHGYAIQEVKEGNPFFEAEKRVKGHEFHHSRLIFKEAEKINLTYHTVRGKGIIEEDEVIKDGLTYKNTFATYHHFHAASDASWAKNFVALARTYQKSNFYFKYKKNIEKNKSLSVAKEMKVWED